MSEAMVALIRSVITFLSLLIFARILGKTQISQLSFFEYVSGITIGSIAGEMSTDLAVRIWPMYVSLMVWVGLTLGVQFLTLKSRWMGKMMDGEPVVVIQNGQILERNLRTIRMRQGELDSMLRSQGYFDHKQIEFAVVEPKGELSVLVKSQQRPVTPADLNLPTKYEGLGIELIVDGEVMYQNLQRLGVDQNWLAEKLRERGIYSPGEVFLAAMNTQGEIFIDRYQDRVANTDDISDYPGPN